MAIRKKIAPRRRHCCCAPAAAAEERRAQEEVGDQGDHADEHADERREADVEVAHVRHLVGDHALQLVAAHHLQQPGGHRHRGVLRVATGGEGVGGRVVDDIDRRHGRCPPRSPSPRPRPRGPAPGRGSRAAPGWRRGRCRRRRSSRSGSRRWRRCRRRRAARCPPCRCESTATPMAKPSVSSTSDDDRDQQDRVALVAGDLVVHGRAELGYCAGCWGGLAAAGGTGGCCAWTRRLLHLHRGAAGRDRPWAPRGRPPRPRRTGGR